VQRIKERLDDDGEEMEGFDDEQARDACGFHLARTLHGVLFELGYAPLKIRKETLVNILGDCREAIELWMDQLMPVQHKMEGLPDIDDVFDAVGDRWYTIKTPRGADPVVAAYYRALDMDGTAPGIYMSATGKAAASLVWKLLHHLTDEDGTAYLAARKAESVLGYDKSKASRVIRALKDNGVLKVEVEGTMGRASRYRLLIHPK